MIRRTLLMLLALALATAAACGGDDDSDDSADAPPETSETTEDATDDPATGDEGGEDDGSPGAGTELEVDREFTGEDSEPFCTQVRDVVTGTRDADSDAEVISDAEFADQMAAMDVPGEIADEWETLYTVQRAVAEDPDGDVFATMDPDESEDWAMAGAIVAAYLGDVCEISDDG
jgi:hypothetical protein